MEKYLMVIALNIGSTDSEYAFSIASRSQFISDRLTIHLNATWEVGARAQFSIKTPTCLLLNDSKEFVAFGYEAENQYAELLLEEDHDSYYYFDRFMFYLHGNKNITHDMLLDDITCAKQLPAIEVLQHSIKYFVDHSMAQLKKQGSGIRLDEVRWVIIIPAIWSEPAKCLMRNSAEKAGIQTNDLILASEPEAASIYFQYLPVENWKEAEQGLTIKSYGTKYMLVNIGDCTTEITVNQQDEENQLRELHIAIGNDCGGNSLDRNFLKLLKHIVGKNVLSYVKKHHVLAYKDLIREFDCVKQYLKLEMNAWINITIPFVALNDVCKEVEMKELREMIQTSRYSSDVRLRGDKLRINANLLKHVFAETIAEIIELMTVVLSRKGTSEVSIVLMVGNITTPLIQKEIRAKFPEKIIFIPELPELAVLKGAVLFG